MCSNVTKAHLPGYIEPLANNNGGKGESDPDYKGRSTCSDRPAGAGRLLGQRQQRLQLKCLGIAVEHRLRIRDSQR